MNAVGVDLNTASAPLLTRVSGLSASTAAAIVRWRDAHGAFRNRHQLLEVTGLGPRTFEQSAGFLRIRDGDQPLDRTGVHPETYPLVEKMLGAARKPIGELMGRADVLRTTRLLPVGWPSPIPDGDALIAALVAAGALELEAAIAITMALSPAKTKSITIIANKAEKNSGLNSSN